MRRKQYWVIAFLFLLGWGCVQEEATQREENPVLKIGSRVWYGEDVAAILPRGIERSDSLALMRKYLTNLAKKELVYEKAKDNFGADPEIQRLVEEYRRTLVVHRYEQEVIESQLDRQVDDKDIVAYYEKFSESFYLDQNIIQGVYVKVPLDAPKKDELRKWYKSDKPEDVVNLESYCYQYATSYDYFEENWFPFDAILKQTPVEISDQRGFLRKNKTIEVKDSLFHYFVHIKSFKIIGEVAPLGFVDKKIKNILNTQKKLDFINKFEDEIYQDALNAGQVVFY